jgi:peptidoglycan-associated lipoprotein
MRITLRTLLLTGAITWISATASGQATSAPEPHELDLTFTYSPQFSNLVNGPNFWLQGGALDLSAEFYHGLSIVSNIAGERASNISSSGVDLTMVTATFGPRYTWAPKEKFAVFGHGLIGEAFGLDSVFPSLGGAQTDFNTLALQVGGGVDLRLSKHFGLRAVQADWVRTQFPNSTTNVQNNLRLGAGIVFRLQRQMTSF